MYNEKVFFMRLLIVVLVLILNLQSFTKADDITQFEIEGMSVVVLNYFSKEHIKKNINN